MRVLGTCASDPGPADAPTGVVGAGVCGLGAGIANQTPALERLD